MNANTPSVPINSCKNVTFSQNYLEDSDESIIFATKRL